MGEAIANIDPLGSRTSYTYQYGQRSTVENPLGAVTTYQRDLVNRVTAEIDALGNRTTYTYDLDGRLVATTNPLGARWTTLYDSRGRVEATIDPLGNRTTYWLRRQRKPDQR